MRKYLILIVLLLSVYGYANDLVINPGMGIPGSTRNEVAISLSNDVPIRGIQLQIADSLNYLTPDSVWTLKRTSGFDIAYSTEDTDGHLTVLLFSSTSLPASNGEIIRISYSVSKQAPLNSLVDLKFKMAILVGEAYETLSVTKSNGVFKVSGMSAVEPNGTTPVEFSLDQNYPNPFNPTTSIPFCLKKTGETTLTIYNMLGQQVRSLVNNTMTAGSHKMRWDGLDDYGLPVSAGIYIYRLKSGDFNEARQLTLVR
jgi:hypothetical protein